MIHKNMRVLTFLILLLGIVSIVQAATIRGTVYDLDLLPVENVIIEIDTTPHQRMVAQDGSYTFSVPDGDYHIKAMVDQGDSTFVMTVENISIQDEGSYVLDLFLFPDLEEEEEILQDIDIDVAEGIDDEEQQKWVLYGAIVGIFIVVLIIFFKLLPLMRKKTKESRKKEEASGERATEKEAEEKEGIIEGDLDKVVAILKKHDGRITQKDLRRELPLSEAKVSLMVAELEHQGRIKKIKKGRGNILILQP